MSETKHTPGPWERVDGFVVEADTPEGTVVVCNTRAPDMTPYDECRANARLIAAAPDLLEAAKAMMAHMGYVNADGEWTVREDHPLSMLRAAIAKAEGDRDRDPEPSDGRMPSGPTLGDIRHRQDAARELKR